MKHTKLLIRLQCIIAPIYITLPTVTHRPYIAPIWKSPCLYVCRARVGACTELVFNMLDASMYPTCIPNASY